LEDQRKRKKKEKCQVSKLVKSKEVQQKKKKDGNRLTSWTMKLTAIASRRRRRSET
jgi:hypothetical protein